MSALPFSRDMWANRVYIPGTSDAECMTRGGGRTPGVPEHTYDADADGTVTLTSNVAHPDGGMTEPTAGPVPPGPVAWRTW